MISGIKFENVLYRFNTTQIRSGSIDQMHLNFALYGTYFQSSMHYIKILILYLYVHIFYKMILYIRLLSVTIIFCILHARTFL